MITLLVALVVAGLGVWAFLLIAREL